MLSHEFLLTFKSIIFLEVIQIEVSNILVLLNQVLAFISNEGIEEIWTISQLNHQTPISIR